MGAPHSTPLGVWKAGVPRVVQGLRSCVLGGKQKEFFPGKKVVMSLERLDPWSREKTWSKNLSTANAHANPCDYTKQWPPRDCLAL